MAKYRLSDIFEGNYPVSQKYGNNVPYYSQFGLQGHEGVDYALPVGTPVLAPFDGVILRDNDDFKNNTYGNFVVIWDPIQKVAVWHCHLSGNSVSYNQQVKRGQRVGLSGNSGNSSGSHLHENFVETDAQGNRLNKDNGKQGFLNILDPSLVEWIPINSSGTTPQPPMADQRQAEFDSAHIALRDAGYAPAGSGHEYWFSNPADPHKFTNQIKSLINDAKKPPVSAPISEADKQKLREEGRKQGVKESREKLQNALNNLA